MDSNQILHNNINHQVVIVRSRRALQQIQDGGRPPFYKSVAVSQKLKNREIWGTAWPISTKLGFVMQKRLNRKTPQPLDPHWRNLARWHVADPTQLIGS